jgi:ATP-binding cassette subfamily F protein 3
LIQLTNITKSFAKQELFSNLNFKLNPKNRVGLVGRNGSGKSTLFKIILDEEHIDGGEVSIPKNYKIGSLKQHLSFSENTLLKEASLALDEQSKYDVYKVEKILFGLGFVKDDLNKNPLSFSGGYQIRINLAKLLVTKPNLLLLDEPTNYLDIVSLRWLKLFLKSFEGEVILITHNRDFMDSVCTHTMGIVRKKLRLIEGNTHKFYEQLRANDELHVKTKASQDKKIKELEEFIAKNKTRASTAALAQSKVKQLEKIERLEDIQNEATLDFDFNYKETPAKVLLEAKEISFGYTPEVTLFKDISFTLKKGECLAIIGKNGKGKSTLLNTLANELKPTNGEVAFHVSTSFAHFGQTNINHLNLNNSVFDEIYGANATLSMSRARSICGAMMFSGDSADKKISLLSGGEKSRVMLGKILVDEVNLLFLDEPTNHLDMDSIDSLTKAIKNFNGAVVIVTHSEELLRAVADRLIIFRKDGAELFDRDYDEFLEKIGWEEESVEKRVKTVPKSNQHLDKKQRAYLISQRNKKISPLKKRVEKVEKQIIETEEKLEVAQNELLSMSSATDIGKLVDISKKVAFLETQIETDFESLELLQNQIDEIIEEYEKEMKKF